MSIICVLCDVAKDLEGLVYLIISIFSHCITNITAINKLV